MGKPREAVEEEIEAARRAGDQEREAQLLILLGDSLLGAGDLRQGEALLREALVLLNRQEVAFASLPVLLKCASLSRDRGAYGQASRDLEQVVQLSRALKAKGHLYTPQSPVQPSDALLYTFVGGLGLDWPLPGDRGAGAEILEAMGLSALGEVAFMQGDYAGADRLLLSALDTSGRLGPAYSGSLDLLLAQSAQKQKEPDVAARHLTRALSRFGGENCKGDAPASLRQCLLTLNALTDSEREAGRLDSALAWNDRALRAAERQGDPLLHLEVLSSRCLVLPWFDFVGQQAVLAKAETVLGDVKSPTVHQRCLVQVSATALCAREPEKALSFALQAEQSLREHPNQELAVAIRSLAETARMKLEAVRGMRPLSLRLIEDEREPKTARAMELDQAMEAQRRDYREWKDGDPAAALAGILKSRGVSQQDVAEVAKILAELQGARTLSERVAQLERVEATLQRQGLLRPEDLKDLDALVLTIFGPDPVLASRELIKLITGSSAGPLPGREAAERFLTSTLLAMSDRSTALNLAREWTRACEAAAEGGRLASVGLMQAERAQQAYETTLELLLHERRFDEAFTTAERARSYSMMRWLGKAQPDPFEGGDDQMAEGLAKTKERITRLELDLERASQAERSQLEEKLAAEWDAYDEWLLRLKLTQPRYAELASAETANLEKVQRQLPPNTTLVSFFALPTRTLAWVVGARHREFVELKLPHAELFARAYRFRAALAGPGTVSGAVVAQGVGRSPELVPEARAMSVVDHLAEELFRSLIGPLPHLQGSRNLIIMPHGELHLLPWAALKDHRSGRYLVEQYTLTLIPGASSLLVWGAPTNVRSFKAIVLGDPTVDTLDPLLGARREAMSIAGLLGSRALLRSEATEAIVRSEAHGLSLLHLAAHGKFNDVTPKASYVALARSVQGAREFDGRLRMSEVLDELRFGNKPLVVLSGCETGLGRRAGGDEVEGFTRSFMFAGAEAVVATLWQVHDEASRLLLEDFYRQLLGGRNVADALAIAQRAMIERSPYREPYFWAAFGVTGNPQMRPVAAR